MLLHWAVRLSNINFIDSIPLPDLASLQLGRETAVGTRTGKSAILRLQIDALGKNALIEKRAPSNQIVPWGAWRV
jgi:hypothetical protein